MPPFLVGDPLRAITAAASVQFPNCCSAVNLSSLIVKLGKPGKTRAFAELG